MGLKNVINYENVLLEEKICIEAINQKNKYINVFTKECCSQNYD